MYPFFVDSPAKQIYGIAFSCLCCCRCCCYCCWRRGAHISNVHNNLHGLSLSCSPQTRVVQEGEGGSKVIRKCIKHARCRRQRRRRRQRRQHFSRQLAKTFPIINHKQKATIEGQERDKRQAASCEPRAAEKHKKKPNSRNGRNNKNNAK